MKINRYKIEMHIVAQNEIFERNVNVFTGRKKCRRGGVLVVSWPVDFDGD